MISMQRKALLVHDVDLPMKALREGGEGATVIIETITAVNRGRLRATVIIEAITVVVAVHCGCGF